MTRDPGETIDVRAQHPGVFQDLMAEYAAHAARTGVQVMPEGYESQKAVERNSLARFFEHNRVMLIVIALVILAALHGLWRPARATWRTVMGLGRKHRT